MSQPILVHIDLDGETRFVGRLWTRSSSRGESASFEYDKVWLEFPWRFALEPALTLSEGAFYTQQDRAIFGAFGDSAPDRWGRMLMRRAAKRFDQTKNRALRTLQEVDYLLLVDDETRQGALRFSYEPGGPFLTSYSKSHIPPLIRLPRLLDAVENVLGDEESDECLRLLLAPGSSLGGARPKAAVRDKGDLLAMAKFPRKDDDTDSVAWEAVALDLAEKAGILVPERRVETVAGEKVLILRRFDRRNAFRVPYLSAMSMIGARDNETHSYLEIADALRRYGAQAALDLTELWRRMVFTILISNVDDHLRNHGFLCSNPAGWVLSPVFDLNPTPTDIHPRILSTSIDYEERSASLELAYSVAGYFGLSAVEAVSIAHEVGISVSKWRNAARAFGISRTEVERMATAFEHTDLEKAISGSRHHGSIGTSPQD